MVIVMLQAVKKMHTEFFRVDTVNSPEFSFEDIPFFLFGLSGCGSASTRLG
jgi:hypothetical protein